MTLLENKPLVVDFVQWICMLSQQPESQVLTQQFKAMLTNAVAAFVNAAYIKL